MKKILLISRRAERCGVNDYGKRLYNIIKKSKKFNILYREIDTQYDFINIFNDVLPDLVIYNYYISVLPFLTNDFLSPIRGVPNIIIYHEGPCAFNPDGALNVASTTPDEPNKKFFSLPRPTFEDIEFSDIVENEIPTIGSFGFGFMDKNFPRIAELVCEQFDVAKIRLSVPYATFGDNDGNLARQEMDKVRNVIEKKNNKIQLEVSHDFLNQMDMLKFLKQNDVNIYLYDLHRTRTLSSTIDYSLSVRKPIAISDSWMFRHISDVTPTILVDKTTIPEIIKNGIEPLKPIYEKYTHKSLVDKFEYSINYILNK